MSLINLSLNYLTCQLNPQLKIYVTVSIKASYEAVRSDDLNVIGVALLVPSILRDNKTRLKNGNTTVSIWIMRSSCQLTN